MTRVHVTQRLNYAGLRATLEAPVGEALVAAGIGPGSRVLLKPNLVGPFAPDRGVTTHPEVLTAVAALLADAGVEMWVGDSPSSPSGLPLREVMAACGLLPVARRFGMTVVQLGSRGVVRPLVDGHRQPLARTPFDVDAVVNLPKLKTHTLTVYSGALKNLMGCVPGNEKRRIHRESPSPAAFARRLQGVYEALADRVCVTVLDGVLGMDGAGPTNGRTRTFGRLLVSTSIPAIDAVGARILGLDPDEVPHLRGLVPTDLEVVGDASPLSGVDLRARSRLHRASATVASATLGHLFYTQTSICPRRCTGCGDCVEACPTGAIGLRASGPARIAAEHCVQCGVCAERCGDGAVVTWASRALRLVRAAGALR